MAKHQFFRVVGFLSGILFFGGISSSPVVGQEKVIGFGFQSSWPSYGLSARMAVSETGTLQGVIGALGPVRNFSGRYNHTFQRRAKYSTFAYGSAGVWTWGGGAGFPSETSFGAGAGVGIEYDWRAMVDDEDFPPLMTSFEVGLGWIEFENYDFSMISFGLGMHYEIGR